MHIKIPEEHDFFTVQVTHVESPRRGAGGWGRWAQRRASAVEEGTVGHSRSGGETLLLVACRARPGGEDSRRPAGGGCLSWVERLLGFWDTVSSQREEGEAREHLGRLMQSRGEAEARQGGARAEE